MSKSTDATASSGVLGKWRTTSKSVLGREGGQEEARAEGVAFDTYEFNKAQFLFCPWNCWSILNVQWELFKTLCPLGNGKVHTWVLYLTRQEEKRWREDDHSQVG